jgi:cellulose synthase/poly-beta-1,6-N-acetylglucosamine synthase-like glycosyltransferase
MLMQGPPCAKPAWRTIRRTGRGLGTVMTDGLPGIRYSIVLPVFNEAAVLPILLRRLTMLMEQVDGPAETIFVDDGSSDCTPIVLKSLAREDARFRYIGLSRNFGHQVARLRPNKPIPPNYTV